MSDKEEFNPFKLPKYLPPEEEKKEESPVSELLKGLDSSKITIVTQGGERREIDYVPNNGDMMGAELAMKIVAAEESARIMSNNLKQSFFELRHSFTPSIIAPTVPGETAPKTVWGTRKIELDNYIISNSEEILTLSGKAGVLVDMFVTNASTNFSVYLIIDGNDLYNHTYTELAAQTKSDTNLSAYYDSGASIYVVALHNIYFMWECRVILGGSDQTFGKIRINYNIES